MKKKFDNRKLYVVRKKVWAKTVKEAIRLEKRQEAHEVFIDEKWENNAKNPADCIGFQVDKTNNDY